MARCGHPRVDAARRSAESRRRDARRATRDAELEPGTDGINAIKIGILAQGDMEQIFFFSESGELVLDRADGVRLE